MDDPEPSTAVALPPPKDAGRLGFPPTLPVDLALRGTAPIADVFRAYGLTRDDYENLRVDPTFRRAVADAIEMLKRDGASFRIRARVQAEAYLGTLWSLAHDTTGEVPAKVKFEIAQATTRWAGYDVNPNGGNAGGGNSLTINIDLS